jgi:phenylpropionate dioxygenase-like ring-hydroxylating dioxygenase large terminal subunit
MPKEERAPIMDIEEWQRDDWRFTDVVAYDWPINYIRSTENALDPAHAEFVHQPYFGNGGTRPGYSLPSLELIEERFRFGCRYNTPIEVGDKAAGADPSYVTAGTVAYGPCQYVTILDMNTKMSIRQYTFVTPVDERNERLYLISGRNFNIDKENDAEFDRVNWQVVEQDRCVLESVQPALNPLSNKEEVLVTGDNVIALYRNRIQQWQDAGFRIDCNALDEHARSGNKAFAIPSPARRKQKGWVIAPVPLL